MKDYKQLIVDIGSQSEKQKNEKTNLKRHVRTITENKNVRQRARGDLQECASSVSEFEARVEAFRTRFETFFDPPGSHPA